MGGVGVIVLLLLMLTYYLFCWTVIVVLPQRINDVGDIFMFLQRTGAGGEMYTNLNDFGYVFCDSASGKVN